MEKEKNELNELIDNKKNDTGDDTNIDYDTGSPQLNKAKGAQGRIEDVKPGKTLQEQFSAVASAPAQKKLFLLSIIAVISGILYYVLFRSDSFEQSAQQTSKTSADKEAIIKESMPVPQVNEQQISVVKPQLPEPPPLKEPIPPEPPPAPLPPAPPLPQLPEVERGKASPSTPPRDLPNVNILPQPFQDNNSLEKQKQVEARRKAGIMVVGSGTSKASVASGAAENAEKKTEETSPKKSGRFLGFGDGAFDGDTLQKTSSPQVTATKTSQLERTLLQGKIIYAVLETAINTDLPGTLRAVVTRDTYAEAGKNILVPKGSRLVGSYQSSVANGQTRVNVVWDRMIRPDGIDIAIGSAGTDQLGRAGVPGELNTRLLAKLTNAFLVSILIPVASAKLSNGQVTTTTIPGTGGTPGTQTKTGDATAMALQQGTQQFSEIAKEAIQSNFPTKPTITIDQGTRINILVQKDLIFPSSEVLNNRVLGR